MTKRYRAMKLALQLHQFARRMKEQRNDSWGAMVGYTFHAPGQILHFRRIADIEKKATEIARSAKCL